MEKSILSILTFVCVLFVLLACPQGSWAGYQSTDSNLPPLGGHYISPQEWHALYANGIIVKDPIHSAFTATFPPPAPDMNDTHSFSSQVEIMVSMDGGLTYQPFWADATVTVYIECTEPNYYDTEMTQLDVSGGSLPPGVMIRESPTLVSSGHTTITPVGGGYQIDSFFDIYTEVSADGGATWYADTNAPAHMTLAEGGICHNPTGDLDADNDVDWSDVGIMADQWLQSSGSADLDSSGNIDFLDYALLAANWEEVGNCSPLVDAGLDQVITLPVADANLDGVATDEYGYIYGLPTPPGAITTLWTVVSGPNDVTFGDANQVDTAAHFDGPGVYVLRLTADDGKASTSDDVTITVNQGPVVDAGNDQTITYHYPDPTSASLDGTVTDDGLPDPPGAVTTLWTKQSGTGTVTFGDASAVDTTATFPDAGGVFVLRLTANDGDTSAYDEVQITVVGKPAFSETADYYVDGYTGDDANPGTANEPFKTINYGASKLTGAAAKDKVLVWGGGGGGRPATQTYAEQVQPPNCTADSAIRRDPASGEAIIQGNGSNYPFYSNGKAHLVLDGFTCKGGTYGVYLFGDNADNCTIKNCRITNNAWNGIRVREGDNTTIHNCAVYKNNTVGTAYANIYIWGSTGSVTGCKITSCSIYGGGNTIGKYGIQALTTATIDLIKNCIVTNHKMGGSYGILEDSGATITAISRSDMWDNGTNYSTGCPTPTDSIYLDPKFVDPGNGNFHLGTGSPCIGAGRDEFDNPIDMGYRYIDTAL